MSESGALHGKTAYKKENGTHNYSSASPVAFGMTGNNLNQRPPAQRLVVLDSLLLGSFLRT